MQSDIKRYSEFLCFMQATVLERQGNGKQTKKILRRKSAGHRKKQLVIKLLKNKHTYIKKQVQAKSKIGKHSWIMMKMANIVI